MLKPDGHLLVPAQVVHLSGWRLKMRYFPEGRFLIIYTTNIRLKIGGFGIFIHGHLVLCRYCFFWLTVHPASYCCSNTTIAGKFQTWQLEMQPSLKLSEAWVFKICKAAFNLRLAMANRVLKWQSSPHHLLHVLFRGKLLVVAGVLFAPLPAHHCFLTMFICIYIYIGRIYSDFMCPSCFLTFPILCF